MEEVKKLSRVEIVHSLSLFVFYGLISKTLEIAMLH